MISCGAADVVGVCPNCGGAVTVPRVSWALFPPAPSCESCGHTPRKRVAVVGTCARLGMSAMSMGAAA